MLSLGSVCDWTMAMGGKLLKLSSGTGSMLVKWVVRMMEIRWMNSDVNRPSGVDEGRRRR